MLRLRRDSVCFVLSLCVAMVLGFSACANVTAMRKEKADAHYRMANSYLQRGRGFSDEVNRRAAYRDLLEAIRLDPQNANYRLVLGTLYLYNQEYGKAEREMKRALELNPGLAEAHNQLGLVYIAQDSLDKAVQEFMTALNNLSYQTPSIAYFNLGKANFQLGDFLAAAEAFQNTLSILPANEEAQFYLGRSFVKLGKLAEAEKAFSAALEMKPESPRTHYELGMVLFKLNRKAEASRHFERVVELDPEGELGEQSKTYIKLLR